MGLKLVRDDGKEVWFTRGILSPVNFIGRQMSRAKTIEQKREMMQFFFSRYQEHYALLEQGYYPNQRIFGKWGYPGHNPYLMFNYDDFPPNRITALAYIDERYDRETKNLVERRIYYSYLVQENRMLLKKLTDD